MAGRRYSDLRLQVLRPIHASQFRLWEIACSKSTRPVALPPLIAAFLESMNDVDLDRLMSTFSDDALVNDQLSDYWGKAAIRS